MVIFIGGSAAFAFSMWKDLHNTASIDSITKSSNDMLGRFGAIDSSVRIVSDDMAESGETLGKEALNLFYQGLVPQG